MDLLSKLKALAATSPSAAPAPAAGDSVMDKLLAARLEQKRLPAPPAPRALLSDQLAVPGLPAATDLEMIRILRLEMWLPPSEAEVEEISRRYILAEYFDGPEKFRFKKPQAWAIRDFERFGALAHVPVGQGKTLLSLVLAQIAFTQKSMERILLFVPAQVRAQLVFADIPWARRRVNITTPIIDLGDLTPKHRARRAQRERGLFIMPYSTLSGRDGAELLDSIEPQLIIADEAHSLRARNTARTRRFLKWINGREISFVPMSGTLTSKSLRDYHHLAHLALGEGIPIPIHAMAAKEWGDVLDSEAQPNEYQLRMLAPLRDWARGSVAGDYPPTVEGSRRAFEARFNSAPGVIMDQSEIGTSLTYCNSEILPPDGYPGYKQVEDLITQVDVGWITPNGDDIDHGMLKWKWIEELSAGFYHKLSWPDGLDPAVLDRAKIHHMKQQVYHRVLRDWLKHDGVTGMDTPFLVGQDMVRHADKNVGSRLYTTWKSMKEAAWPEMPERDSQAVRLCDFKVAAAANWANTISPEEIEQYGAILWVHHQELGRWLMEILGQGPHRDRLLWAPSAGERRGIDEILIDPAYNRGKVIVASIKAHGTGKNLQWLQNMLVVQWPRDAKTAEQMVGRLHHTGQEADHLDIHMMRSTLHDHINFAACLNDALYVEQTMGMRQKLLFGTHDPLPKIYSPAFLRAQGLQPEALNQAGQARMQEHFGGYSDGKV